MSSDASKFVLTGPLILEDPNKWINDNQLKLSKDCILHKFVDSLLVECYNCFGAGTETHYHKYNPDHLMIFITIAGQLDIDKYLFARTINGKEIIIRLSDIKIIGERIIIDFNFTGNDQFSYKVGTRHHISSGEWFFQYYKKRFLDCSLESHKNTIYEILVKVFTELMNENHHVEKTEHIEQIDQTDQKFIQLFGQNKQKTYESKSTQTEVTQKQKNKKPNLLKSMYYVLNSKFLYKIK